MTAEQQRIAIATALGMTAMTDKCNHCDGIGRCGSEGDCWQCRKCKGTGVGESRYIGANYTGDLNACHKMETWAFNDGMDSDQWSEYGRQLMLAHPTASLSFPAEDKGDSFYEIACIATATAAQRAESFLKTLNLWTGDE